MVFYISSLQRSSREENQVGCGHVAEPFWTILMEDGAQTATVETETSKT